MNGWVRGLFRWNSAARRYSKTVAVRSLRVVHTRQHLDRSRSSITKVAPRVAVGPNNLRTQAVLRCQSQRAAAFARRQLRSSPPRAQWNCCSKIMRSTGPSPSRAICSRPRSLFSASTLDRLTPLPAVSPSRLRHFAPRHGAHIHEPIPNARAFGLAIKARRANIPPPIEHDGSPSLLGLYSERHDVSTVALVACWRYGHPPDLGSLARTSQRGFAPLLNGRSRVG
jgi:hypothetical protein